MNRIALLASATLLLATPTLAETKIVFGTNWLPQTEHCGFYQAAAGGLYAAAGLDVEIVPGGPDINVQALVAGGRYQLGMGSSFTTLNMLAEGIPAKTVAAYFQKDPQTIVVHPDQGVDSLDDLVGKPVMIAQFSQYEFWQFLKVKFGFSDDQLARYTYSAGPFLADKSAAQQGYVTEDAFLLGAEMDAPPVSLLLADYGYENYASTVFGLSDWIDANREAVAAFVAATAEGYAACIAGEADAAKAAILDANPDHGEALYDFKLAKMQELNMVTGEDGLPVGSVSADRVGSFFATMAEAGVYPADLAYEDAFDFSFFASE